MSYFSKSIVRCHREPMFMDRIHLYLYFQSDKGSGVVTQLATLPTLVQINPEDGILHPSPTMDLHMEEAQKFMDELWRCGLRPTEGTGSAGSLAATERHLNDMRALVGKQLGVELK